LAALLVGAEPAAAARAGHELAGTVVRYSGAIFRQRQPVKGRHVEPEQVEDHREAAEARRCMGNVVMEQEL